MMEDWLSIGCSLGTLAMVVYLIVTEIKTSKLLKEADTHLEATKVFMDRLEKGIFTTRHWIRMSETSRYVPNMRRFKTYISEGVSLDTEITLSDFMLLKFVDINNPHRSKLKRLVMEYEKEKEMEKQK